MPVIAHFEEVAAHPERRGAPRRSLKLGVGGANPVTLRDMSLTGMLIESAQPMLVGATFEVDLPGHQAGAAVVVWNSGEFYGCEFHQPISAAALSASQLRSTPEREPPAPRDSPLANLRDLTDQVDRIAGQLDDIIERLRDAQG